MPFKPGQSGNPGGQPKHGFRALVRDKTKDGALLIEEALKVLRSKKASNRDKLTAVEYLTGYGWSKPKFKQEISAPKGPLIVFEGTGPQVGGLEPGKAVESQEGSST